jgi:hypothetical protein
MFFFVPQSHSEPSHLNFMTLKKRSAITTRTSVISTRTRVILTLSRMILHAKCSLHPHSVIVHAECDLFRQEFNFDTYERDYDKLECDLYRQSVISTRRV